jgi:Sap, sulfolipid-1-addressing protein
VVAQAAGFAVLAAISPTALLVIAVFLGSANPRMTALFYVAGAMLMTVAMAVIVLVILRTTGLNEPRHHDPRYGLRLGLGVLALASAAFVARRRREPPEPATDQPASQGFIARLVARPRPATALATGVVLFAPSATFIAAVQVVATARADVAATTLALVVVVIITGLVVWLPLLTYLATPDATGRALKKLNGWLRKQGRLILFCALAVGGVALVINGALGLTSG